MQKLHKLLTVLTFQPQTSIQPHMPSIQLITSLAALAPCAQSHYTKWLLANNAPREPQAEAGSLY